MRYQVPEWTVEKRIDGWVLMILMLVLLRAEVIKRDSQKLQDRRRQKDELYGHWIHKEYSLSIRRHSSLADAPRRCVYNMALITRYIHDYHHIKGDLGQVPYTHHRAAILQGTYTPLLPAMAICWPNTASPRKTMRMVMEFFSPVQDVMFMSFVSSCRHLP